MGAPPYMYTLKLELSGAEAVARQKSSRGAGTSVPRIFCERQPLAATARLVANSTS